jgi:hypothetical protein
VLAVQRRDVTYKWITEGDDMITVMIKHEHVINTVDWTMEEQ